VPDYAGIRPKISGPKDAARDFLVDVPTDHGLPGLVQLFGIESPGVTASLALADELGTLAARLD
jgi:L-2-hydroxyglutarate oxidase LhgO